MTLLIHGVDLLRYLLKKDFTKINCAKTWNAFATEEPDFKDSALFIAEMDDITVNADISYSAPRYPTLPDFWRFEFWGTQGLMTFNFFDKEIHIYKRDKEIIDCPDSKSEFWRDMLLEIKGEKTILNHSAKHLKFKNLLKNNFKNNLEELLWHLE